MKETSAPLPIVLLVDDDQISRIALSRAVKMLDIENQIATARDGLEALDYLAAQAAGNAGTLPPVVVLLDVNMPRMNGVEFCNAVTANTMFDGLVIYAFGARELAANVKRALDPRVAGYVGKDKPLDALATAVGHAPRATPYRLMQM